MHHLGVGDVLGYSKQKGRLAGRVQDRDLLRVQESGAFSLGLDGLLRDIDKKATSERLSIRCDEPFGLLGGEKIEVVLADHLLTRQPEQLLACQIETDEPQLDRVLYKDHVGDVFDHRVQKFVGGTQFL